jgi:DNA-binding MarR family transcriptional regulator
MKTSAYIDGHPLRAAFVANILDRLVELIVTQGEHILADVDIEFPSRAVSSVLLIGENSSLTAADLAKTLNQPHQLITQRIDLLLNLDIIKRVNDPSDKRRKTLQLTPKGVQQHDALKMRLIEAEQAFNDLFEELECDLSALAVKAINALQKKTILDRITSRQP